ncbi:CIA30 family protein [Xanthomarina sp. F1114]|uniref:CIA30 family protein n=1 Tax=Xanthomarina sp. F1114 TaxID=2996019 RepID=UPI00225E3086|nr:CIA30 family protein [Xanthomarina sp. F1114]MCX7546938.1 CIA30 family protein [Xanthomarina sp. F1114]
MINSKNNIIDFGSRKDGQDWMIVNDDVMGGLSNSTMALTENSLIFRGELSFKNNGGFASIRSSDQNFDLSIYKTIHIKFRSNDRDFAFRLASSKVDSRINYKHYFSSETTDWEIMELKMNDFQQYNRGQITKTEVDVSKLNNIIRVGVMISDKKEGLFEIEIDTIEFK